MLIHEGLKLKIIYRMALFDKSCRQRLPNAFEVMGMPEPEQELQLQAANWAPVFLAQPRIHHRKNTHLNIQTPSHSTGVHVSIQIVTSDYSSAYNKLDCGSHCFHFMMHTYNPML